MGKKIKENNNKGHSIYNATTFTFNTVHIKKSSFLCTDREYDMNATKPGSDMDFRGNLIFVLL